MSPANSPPLAGNWRDLKLASLGLCLSCGGPQTSRQFSPLAGRETCFFGPPSQLRRPTNGPPIPRHWRDLEVAFWASTRAAEAQKRPANSLQLAGTESRFFGPPLELRRPANSPPLVRPETCIFGPPLELPRPVNNPPIPRHWRAIGGSGNLCFWTSAAAVETGK